VRGSKRRCCILGFVIKKAVLYTKESYSVQERGVIQMNTTKERLLKIIEEISESEVDQLLSFAEQLKNKSYKELSEDLLKASETSLDFWDNDIDDEVWNNV